MHLFSCEFFEILTTPFYRTPLVDDWNVMKCFHNISVIVKMTRINHDSTFFSVLILWHCLKNSLLILRKNKWINKPQFSLILPYPLVGLVRDRCQISLLMLREIKLMDWFLFTFTSSENHRFPDDFRGTGG